MREVGAMKGRKGILIGGFRLGGREDALLVMGAASKEHHEGSLWES